jgi:geranylgeranyl diphosphate synthase type II
MSDTVMLDTSIVRHKQAMPGQAADSATVISRAQADIEARLSALSIQDGGSGQLGEAMRYSLLAPGKRLRPLLCVLVGRGTGEAARAALDAGCAIEMVHTASLIFDDLPAMDDARLRRGRACTHVVFGESTAILAGIALMNRAFGIVAGLRGVGDGVRNRLVRELAQAIGPGGLSGGQQRDLAERADCGDLRSIEALNHLKTGVLFVLAARAGGLAAGASEADIDRLERYACHFGRAFQNADDLLDRVAEPSLAGKDTGKDAGRPSLASLAGPAEARRRILADLAEAAEALSGCRFDGGPLLALLDRFARSLPA